MTAQITKELVAQFLPERISESNKGTFGKVLNVAGCINYQGAAYLSSVAPLKTGAGLVTLATAEVVANNIASSCPWVTFLPLGASGGYIEKNAFETIKSYIDSYSVVSIGPGLSTVRQTVEFCDSVIKYLVQINQKSVIDADALNIISLVKIEKLSQNCVITPHPMELSRLIGVEVEKIQQNRVKYAVYAAEKFGCNVVLKGNKTVVCTADGNVFINTSGCSALAKAGSGDVLTGIISGLVAQGVQVNDAALSGVYLHGLCGEICAKKLTQYCVLATDLVDAIPTAIKHILQE